MKKLKFLIILLLMLVATVIQAETKWYMDEHRVGEGMVLSELDDGRIIFGFYSHVGEFIPSYVLPSPPPFYVEQFCDLHTVWLTGLSTEVNKDVAYGDVFYDVSIPEFPQSRDMGDGIHERISTQYVVGNFILVRKGEGFILYIESNYRMCNLSIFGVNHYMTHVVAK